MRRARRCLRGGAVIRFTGADPARFLRRCAETGIVPEEVRAEGPFTCRLSLPLRDLPRAGKLAEACGGTWEKLSETGLPTLWRAARRRRALAFLLAAAMLGLFVSSLFVWEITVGENDSEIPDSEILLVLAEQGVGVGSFWPGFREDRIRSRALAVLPGLSWLTVNLNGTRARVQVRAAVPAPEIWDPRQIGDVVARTGGVVTSLTVLEGKPLVRRGDAVEAGQVLISADRGPGADGRLQTVRARGEVTARTWRELTASAPLFSMQKTPSGRAKRRFGLLLGKRAYFFSRDSGILPPDCDRMTKVKRLAVKGAFSLPVGWITERTLSYALSEERRDVSVLRSALEEELSARLREELGDAGEVISAVFTAEEGPELLTVTLHAECSERIDREQPRQTDPQEG